MVEDAPPQTVKEAELELEEAAVADDEELLEGNEAQTGGDAVKAKSAESVDSKQLFCCSRLLLLVLVLLLLALLLLLLVALIVDTPTLTISPPTI